MTTRRIHVSRAAALREQLWAAPLMIWIIVFGASNRATHWTSRVGAAFAVGILIGGVIAGARGVAPRTRSGRYPTRGTRLLVGACGSMSTAFVAFSPGHRTLLVSLAVLMALLALWLLGPLRPFVADPPWCSTTGPITVI